MNQYILKRSYDYIRFSILFLCLNFLASTGEAQTTYTWNGSVSSSWTTSSNWTPNGIPGAVDNIIIISAPNPCNLDANRVVYDFELKSGIINPAGYDLTINGESALFNSGTVGSGVVNISNALNTIFGNISVLVNAVTNIHSSTVKIRNTIFQNTLNVTKTGPDNDVSNGGNVFNGVTNMTNSGDGYLMMGNANGDIFNNQAIFNNLGTGNIYVAHNSTGNEFNGETVFNNSPTGDNLIHVSWFSPGTQFNNNIIATSTNGRGVQFCGGNSTASASISSGHTIFIGSGGFSSGKLLLRQFTITGITPTNLTLTGSAEAVLGPSSQFDGTITVTAPNIYSSSTVYNNTTEFTKTDGSNTNASSGGNTFNRDLVVNYFSSNGTGYLSFGQGDPDIFNGDVYSNNNSLNRIIFGHRSANNQFNGNFILTQTGSSVGTALTWDNGSSIIMAPGKTILIGSTGLTSGYIYTQGLTQLGNTPVNLTGTGTSSIYIGSGNSNSPTIINGELTVEAPDVYFRNATLHSNATVTKTGGSNNHNDGKKNAFNGTLNINQQSSSGYFMLGYNSDDEFNDDIIINSTGTGGVNLGWSSGTGTPTLAAGKTIKTGTGGFNAGYLRLCGFTQSGNTPINLNLTGNSTFYVINSGNPCSFGGAVDVTASNIYIQGGIFNDEAIFTKTGGAPNHNDGKLNIFNGPLTINQQSSSGYFMLGYNSNDQFNDDITINCTGTGGIYRVYFKMSHLSG